MNQTSTSSDPEAQFKEQAAKRAVQFVQSGMRVGLGTGSTALFATRRIAELLKTGELSDILAAPPSGTGLIPGRSLDNWGIGYYYAALSPYLKDSLAPKVRIRDEQGWEIFYNFAVTPWLVVGADLQIIRPGLASHTAVFFGLRNFA